MLEALSIGEKGAVRATLHRPEHRLTTTCVVFLAGPGTNRAGPNRIHRALAEHLADSGVASVRFDYQGRGESYGSEDLVDVPSMIEDALAVLEAMRSQLGSTDFFLVGNCVGVVAGILLMEKNRSVLGGAFIAAPDFGERQSATNRALELRDSVASYLRKARSFSTWSKALQQGVDLGAISRALFGTAKRKYRARRTGQWGVGSIVADRNVFFVWGERDDSRRYMDFYRRYCDERRWKYTSILITNASHTFDQFEHRQMLVRKTAEWLLPALGLSRPARPVSRSALVL